MASVRKGYCGRSQRPWWGGVGSGGGGTGGRQGGASDSQSQGQMQTGIAPHSLLGNFFKGHLHYKPVHYSKKIMFIMGEISLEFYGNTITKGTNKLRNGKSPLRPASSFLQLEL